MTDSALAETKSHPGAQIQFWLPDGWSVEKANENAMTAAVGKPVETKINGMPAVAIDAKGRRAGR